MKNRFILTLSCPDRSGIVAAVTQFIAQHQGNILSASQHGEPTTKTFFMRTEIDSDSLKTGFDQFKNNFETIADTFDMNWHLEDSAIKKRVVLLASKQTHCLADILYRWHIDELFCDIPCVISNHSDVENVADWYHVPFHYVPFEDNDNTKSFEQVSSLIDEYNADIIVLARFMRIMPSDLCEKYFGKMINIHHSFLPAFIGANPYQKAFNKGVKLVGATCHYVTEDLDEGPIIEQDVVRIHHGHTPEDIRRLGRNMERMVLASGLRHHLESRVIIHANKTIVF